MAFFNLSPENQQRLAVLVPIVALFLSLFVVYPGVGEYRELNDKIAKQQRELDTLKATPLPAPGPVAPAADKLPTEPSQFLGQMRILAALARCDVRLIDASSGDKAKPAGAAGGSSAVIPVRAHVDLEAPFQQIRNFIALVAQAPRLYVVTDVKVDKQTNRDSRVQGAPIDTGMVHATLEIERYVTPVVAPKPG